MENPISVSSSTIRQFGFNVLFDLLAKNIIVSPSALTNLVNPGSGISSLVITITDPTGYKYPGGSVNPVTLAPVSFSTGNIFNFGVFTILGEVTDTDGKVFQVSVNKNICEPEGWKAGKVAGTFGIDVDCKIPSIVVNELTKRAYSGKSPLSVSQAGSIYYPDNSFDQLDYLFTPFSFGSDTGIFTGNYTIKNTTLAIYDLLDGVTVKVPYVTRQEFEVVCEDSFADILCCINDQYDIVKNNPLTTIATSAKAKLNEITPDLLLAIVNDRTGKSAAEQLARIKTVLNCDCNCEDTGDFIGPQLIGGPSSTVIVEGIGGSSVDPQVSGNTVRYVVSSKEIDIVKTDLTDLSFSITKSGSGTTAIYGLGFNYMIIAKKILDVIEGNPQLTQQLNSLISQATGVDLSGIDGKCIIDLSTCDYSLVESSEVGKTVTGIVVAGQNYAAPSNLLLRNTLQVNNWLSSLNKGVFNVVINGDSSKVTITTAGNINIVSTISFSLNGASYVRLVNRNCKSLSIILQAIITYICSLGYTTTDIKLASKITLCKTIDDVVHTEDYLAGSPLEAYLIALNEQICVLADRTDSGGGTDGVSVQVFVQPSEPTGTNLRNGDLWIVE